jgi:hypothetical protein
MQAHVHPIVQGGLVSPTTIGRHRRFQRSGSWSLQNHTTADTGMQPSRHVISKTVSAGVIGRKRMWLNDAIIAMPRNGRMATSSMIKRDFSTPQLSPM